MENIALWSWYATKQESESFRTFFPRYIKYTKTNYGTLAALSYRNFTSLEYKIS